MATVGSPLLSRENRPSEEDPESSADEKLPPRNQSILKTKALEAWRFTVASGALAGTLILLVNIITLAVMYGIHSPVDYSITFFTGSCLKARNTSVGAHVVINVLGTILLACSNFTALVEYRHPSIRNIFFVAKRKAGLWLLLGASSFPLHMIWNSTVFGTKNSYDYVAVTVTESFLRGGSWTVPSLTASYLLNEEFGLAGWKNANFEQLFSSLQRKARNSELDRLDVEKCIEEYDTDILSNRRHVLLVVDNSHSPIANNSQVPIINDPDAFIISRDLQRNSSILAMYHNVNPIDPHIVNVGRLSGGSLYRWICDEDTESIGDECRSSGELGWIPGSIGASGAIYGDQMSAPILYCYAEKADEQCKVSIIPIFLIVVIVCNVMKVLSFLCVLFLSKKAAPLCTTGDAIQSFLQQPDSHTRGRCLAAKKDYKKWPRASKEWNTRPSGVGDVWSGGKYRWGKAVNKWQWIFYSTVTAGLIITTGVIFCGPIIDWSGVAKESIGEPHSQNTQYRAKNMGILQGFILANVPQLVVSYIYSILTTMLAMAEWCAYSTKSGAPHKGLRVSSPLSNTAQRSKYFLSVPYKWSIPSTVAIITLHWIVSEMQFFARIEMYAMDRSGSHKISTIGRIYSSPFASLVAVCLGSAMLLGLAVISLIKRYPDSIPLSGCCSASIAAACHPSRVYDDETPADTFDPDLSAQKLMWGVVELPDEDTNDNIGHATFAAKETSPPAGENLYA